MPAVILPALWLIVLMAGLPQLSETIYTPSLPEISKALGVREALVEWTLTIYLFGFALGTLFWGRLSDYWGRKPCVIGGLCVFMAGCVGCYLSDGIAMLMVSRLMQGFGGSIGSVLGQAICRDAFHGPDLGKIYSATGSALAVFPALGPLFGGWIAESFGWRPIFLFLMAFALMVMVCVVARLPETHPKASRTRIEMGRLAWQMLRDKTVMGCGLIVGGCNGILFGYFAEGPFYFKILGLSPSYYGLTFLLIALATVMGGLWSKMLHKTHSTRKILFYGILIMNVAILLLTLFTLAFPHVASLGTWVCRHFGFHEPHFDRYLVIAVALFCQMVCAFGICMTTSNALALALRHYQKSIGTASSLFGFFYYCVISSLTFLMGFLHDGTLIPMPLYFCGISVCLVFLDRVLLQRSWVGGIGRRDSGWL